MGFRALPANERNRCEPEDSLTTDFAPLGRASSAARCETSSPFRARVRLARKAVSSSSSRERPRGSAQRTFAPVAAAGRRRVLHLLGQPKPPKRLRGRPRNATSQTTPRRTEVRSRSVNRQPATPSSCVDPKPPKRPRRRPRWCAPHCPSANRGPVEKHGVRDGAPRASPHNPEPPKRPWGR
jgi:hypothetical protein